MDKCVSLFSQLYHFFVYSIKKPKMQLEKGMLIISVDVDVGSRELGVINGGKNDANVNDRISEYQVGKIEEVALPLFIETFNEFQTPVTFALRGQLTEINQRRARDDEGKVKIFVYNMPPCTRRIRELVPVLSKAGIVKIGRIGMAYSIFAPAKKLLDAMSDMLKRDPTLNLCDKVYCRWCREAERKLDLYKKIDNPKYFQKNLLIIKGIALINKFRLKKTQR